MEKCQVAKFDLIGKSFLTVILCYRIDAPLLNQDWHGPGRLVVQGFAIASEVPAGKQEAPPGAPDRGLRGAIRRTRVCVDFGSQRRSPLCQTAVDRGVDRGWVRSLRADCSDVSEGPPDGSGSSETSDQKGPARNPASMSSRRSRLNVKGSIAHHIGR